MSHIWMQSRFGRRCDFLDPKAEDVDFHEIAETLARINRYNGCASPNVSVALHTMICIEIASEEMRPYMALHDAHEAIIGDIITPAAMATAAIAGKLYGALAAAQNRVALSTLKEIHDAAIFAAAGLPLPDSKQKEEMRRIDLAALATERRDFMAPSPEDWNDECEAATPSNVDWSRLWLPEDFQARALLGGFRRHLPKCPVKIKEVMTHAEAA